MADVILLFVFLCGWFTFELSRKFPSCRSLLNSLHNDKSEDALRYIDVVLPDMFQFFLKSPPKVNVHYQAIKSKSEKWLSRFAHSFGCSLAIVNVNTASAHTVKGQSLLCTGVTSHTLFLYPPLPHLQLSFEPFVTGVTGYVFHTFSPRS